MLSNKEGCIHLKHANTATTEKVRERKKGVCESEAGWQVVGSPAPEIVAVVCQWEVSLINEDQDMVCETFSKLSVFKIHNWDSTGKIQELQMSIKYNKCTNMKGEFY